MFCGKCGAEIKPGAKFCTKCGAPVPTAAQEPQVNQQPQGARPTPPGGGDGGKKKNKLVLPLILVAVLAVAAIAAAAFFALRPAGTGGDTVDRLEEEDRQDRKDRDEEPEETGRPSLGGLFGGEGAATPAPAEAATPAPAEPTEPAPAMAPEAALSDEITLWTYPIGRWGDESSVRELTDAFTAETGIKVRVEYLAYADGDDKINTAIAGGNAPDLVMEGPERLVANWGTHGHMVDLSDLLDSTDYSEINPACMAACTAPDGSVYEYPLVMTAHCMAVNLDAFREAGADQYLDLETHTWTTEDFYNAVWALYEHYGDTVGAVYCAGQGGDQGTRALVTNLYGGSFTDPDHKMYTWDDPANIWALEELRSMDGIAFDASLAGGDEIAKFYQGVLKMAFCWNIAQQLNPNAADTGAGRTVTGEEIAFMAFPSDDGVPTLQGGIWGFGVFDNGDEARINAAKEFIRYMCDSEHTADAVRNANYFAVRSAAEGTDLSAVWADNEIMNEYQVLMPYLGDYYQVTPGWAQARTSWWNMLQDVGEGYDVYESVAYYVSEANGAAGW